ncbi:MAG TPA: C4-type zinc ribbon domain-containing protein [Microthrixaceae bacterium]|nr:C4-type zinc ribbon domain-containing protein [Microthrixaceae bacterium]
MISLADLLVVQKLDTEVDQLTHRRATLEERAQRLAAEQQLLEANSQLAGLEAELKSITSTQKEAEDHASLLEDKATSVNTALYDGSVTSHKELESLQAELAQLKANQADFEDRALEQMELAEPVATRIGAEREVVAGIESSIKDLGERIAVAEAEIDSQIAEITASRATAAESVDDSLLETYSKLRHLPGGIAVAELVGSRCGGCHLEIPSGEVEAIRHASDPLAATCPECGCLLVG